MTNLSNQGRKIANKVAGKLGVQIVRTDTLNELVSAQQSLKAKETEAPQYVVSNRQPYHLSAVAADKSASSQDQALSAKHFHELGVEARAKRDDATAFRMFARAISLIPRYEPSRDELRVMSRELLAKIKPATLSEDKFVLLARALEMDPVNEQLRRDLHEATNARNAGPDLTRMCFIFYDGHRARAIHEEAYKRALEFVTIGGVVGDVLEFGVLGGWSSRIFAEVMRDIFNLNNLHLFDSFEGLPEYDSAIDRDSYEIGGRNVWGDKMKFPDEFLKQFGSAHHIHIRERLAEVIHPDRVILHKGFYSETLKEKLETKAAIVHLDCDLYQSTAEVLWGLHDQGALQDGTVMLFDDWNCNKGNPNYGERRAWREYLEGQKRFTATPWYTYGYNGAAYILHDAEV